MGHMKEHHLHYKEADKQYLSTILIVMTVLLLFCLNTLTFLLDENQIQRKQKSANNLILSHPESRNEMYPLLIKFLHAHSFSFFHSIFLKCYSSHEQTSSVDYFNHIPTISCHDISLECNNINSIFTRITPFLILSNLGILNQNFHKMKLSYYTR